jgi:uncharacterized protein YciI
MPPSSARSNPSILKPETAAAAAVSMTCGDQMLFAIHALDRAGALSTRLANYDAHKAFLSDTSRFDVTIVMSGPLTSDDGQAMIGSLFLIEAPGRAEVEAFHRADPFAAAGIWDKISITAFLRRQG